VFRVAAILVRLENTFTVSEEYKTNHVMLLWKSDFQIVDKYLFLILLNHLETVFGVSETWFISHLWPLQCVFMSGSRSEIDWRPSGFGFKPLHFLAFIYFLLDFS